MNQLTRTLEQSQQAKPTSWIKACIRKLLDKLSLKIAVNVILRLAKDKLE